MLLLQLSLQLAWLRSLQVSQRGSRHGAAQPEVLQAGPAARSSSTSSPWLPLLPSHQEKQPTEPPKCRSVLAASTLWKQSNNHHPNLQFLVGIPGHRSCQWPQQEEKPCPAVGEGSEVLRGERTQPMSPREKGTEPHVKLISCLHHFAHL